MNKKQNKENPNNSCDLIVERQYRRQWTNEVARDLTRELCATYEDEQGVNHIDGTNMPQSEEIIRMLELILETLSPAIPGGVNSTEPAPSSRSAPILMRLFRD